jgi:hypothetical protein
VLHGNAAGNPAFGAIVTADITDANITYAKIQNVSATDKVLGRSTAGAGSVEEIACTAVGRALLDDATAADQRTTLGVGTGDSPQFTAIELGHASDTTIARASAGNITVEGNAIYRAGGTDVPLADGGTGASLADPNANCPMGWDDTDGAIKFWTLGNGLTYTAATDTLAADTASDTVDGIVELATAAENAGDAGDAKGYRDMAARAKDSPAM